MSDYQVFARKYRPLTFDDVLGQDHVVQTLRNAIEQDRLAHAYLFVGPRGTGKTSTARILAKALNCTDGPRVDFDPQEGICQEIADGNSLDVLEIDGASNNGVDQVRELRETVSFAPAHGKFKIYYIDEVHMLTTQAFNALLKTLEEPPAHVKFIFATTEPNKILPTILSRCQRFDLRRIPVRIIAEHLAHIATLEGIDLDEAAAYAIAKGADGGMRDAQSMLDQLVAFCGNKITEAEVLDIFGFNSQEAVADFAGVLLAQDTAAALNTTHAQSDAGKDLTKLLGDLISHFRQLLVLKVAPHSEDSDVSPEIAEILKVQAEGVSTERLLAVIDQLAETDGRMKWAANKRLHLEIGIIKAVQILGETNLSDVVALLTDAANAVGAAGSPAPSPSSSAPARAAAPNPSPTPTAKATPSPSPSPSSTPSPSAATSAPAQAPAAAPTPTPTPEAAEANTLAPNTLGGAELWEATAVHCQKARPLIDHYVRDATFLSDNDDEVTIGFPLASLSLDSLVRHRPLLEETLSTLSGAKKRLTFVRRDDLQSAPIPEDAAEDESVAPIQAQPEPGAAADTPPPAFQPPGGSAQPPFTPDGPASANTATKSAPESKSPPPSASADESSSASASETESESEAEDSDPFHNDPLIKSALKEFEATIIKTENR